MQFGTIKCNDAGAATCAGIIRDGGVVVYPTDTVYGIGCDPCNNRAVDRIFEIKSRPSSKALPVLVRDFATADRLVKIGPLSQLIARKFWPGGITILAPIREPRGISQKITAGSDDLAVRVPANGCLLRILDNVKMVVGTSANPSGRPSCTSADEVISSGLSGFDALLDGGEIVAGGIESTIIRERIPSEDGGLLEPRKIADRIEIVRHGAISPAALRTFLLDALSTKGSRIEGL